jgi:hypothetical protein
MRLSTEAALMSTSVEQTAEQGFPKSRSIADAARTFTSAAQILSAGLDTALPQTMSIAASAEPGLTAGLDTVFTQTML